MQQIVNGALARRQAGEKGCATFFISWSVAGGMFYAYGVAEKLGTCVIIFTPLHTPLHSIATVATITGQVLLSHN